MKAREYGPKLLECVKGHRLAAATAPSSSSDGEVVETGGERKDMAPLNTEQERALCLAMQGCNTFITGGAGVGKSFVLSRIVTALQASPISSVGSMQG